MTKARDLASQITIGSTANRPTGFQGQLYYDTTLNNLYQKNIVGWVIAGEFPTVAIDVLIVAGGGSGTASYGGGGGGAGGVLASNQQLNIGNSYS